MNNKIKNDKRSIRTRSVIKKSVMVLLKSKRLEDIGISEIAKIALISRNSFYTHYNSVSDVLDDIFLDIITRFDDIIVKYDYDEFIENPYPMLKELDMCAVASIVGEYTTFFTENPDHNITYSYLRTNRNKERIRGKEK